MATVDLQEPVKTKVLSDAACREQALDITQSFIVQAPAGSGKTGLLTQRFLSLLAKVERGPEECLAITFTRKAASEMRERVLKALKEAQDWVEGSGSNHFQDQTLKLARAVYERDKIEAWDLLSNPARLKIQTIDALSANIARSMPILSRFGASPQITEEAESLYFEAAQNLLAAIETEEPWSESLRLLLMHLDNNLFLTKRLLAEILAHREQWLPHVAKNDSSDETRRLLERSLEIVQQETLNELEAICPKDVESLFPLIQYAIDNLKKRDVNDSDISENNDTIELPTFEFSHWPSSQPEDLKAWAFLADFLLTQEDTLRKTVTQKQGFLPLSAGRNAEEKAFIKSQKEAMLDMLFKLQDYPAFFACLSLIRNCPSTSYTEAQWSILKALFKVLPVLVAELMLVFQSKNQVDYPEVSMAALRALGEVDNPSDLALNLDLRFRHILVDEFQDTSIAQLRLLEQLTAGWQARDGRTLFLVGDPQQSIYRFRQAEVGIFLQVKEQGIGNVRVRSLVLNSNFRSHSTIINWANSFFAELFPKNEDLSCGSIPYVACHSAYGSGEGESEVIDFALLEGAAETLEETEAETDAEDQEAIKLIECIERARKLGPADSMALLVRARSHLPPLLAALRAAEIPFQGVELESLAESQTILDLLSLTSALHHLGDRIAWLSLLRSPWCRLSLSDLYLIANPVSTSLEVQAQTKMQTPIPLLWSTLLEYETLNLSEAGKLALSKFMAVMKPAISEVLTHSTKPFYLQVHELWLKLNHFSDTHHKTPNTKAFQEAQAFFDLLQAIDCSDFNFISKLKIRLQRLYAKEQSNPEPHTLQVMTIHKAKGLEFDSVIIAGLDSRLRPDSEKILLWEEKRDQHGNPYLLLAPIRAQSETEDPIYNYLRLQQKRRSQFEEQRLLYVAATRARKRLYLLGMN